MLNLLPVFLGPHVDKNPHGMRGREKTFIPAVKLRMRLILPFIVLLITLPVRANMDGTDLVPPAVGDGALRVLTPTVLELRQITAATPETTPSPSEFTVTVGVSGTGFRSRVSFASLNNYDLRIDNAAYLKLATPITDNSTVSVTFRGAQYSAVADPLRYSPAIHVNQEGYVPSLPKVAMVGYYLGNMGELPVTATTFNL